MDSPPSRALPAIGVAKRAPVAAASPVITEPSEQIAEVKERLARQDAETSPEGGQSSSAANTAATTPLVQEPQDEQDSAVSSPPSSPTSVALPKLRLSTASTAARCRETEHATEVWDGNEAGLSWGQNRAKDGTWEERWLQQVVKESSPRQRAAAPAALSLEPGTQVLYGRSSGVNTQLAQRWASAWETVTLEDPAPQSSEPGDKPNAKVISRKVKKSVRQYTSDFKTVLEEWEELLTEDIEKKGPDGEVLENPIRIVKVTKAGVDKATSRRWLEETIERRTFEEGTLLNTEVSFEETHGEVRHERHRIKCSDGRESEESIMTTVDNGVKIEVHTATTKDRDGLVAGSESGNSASGKVWESKWVERPNGQREKDDMFKEGDRQWGHKEEVNADGTVFKEKWELTIKDGAEGTQEQRDFTDKWWTGSNGHTWGEKSLKLQKVRKGSDGSASQILEHRHLQEKWYDNTTEKGTDQWETCKIYSRDEQVLVQLVKQGQKMVQRYSDGTEWGDTWSRLYEPLEFVGKQPPTQEALEGLYPEDVEDCTNLQLRVRNTDKWWKEANGNSWGERSYLDFKAKTEKTAKWWNNGKEKQVDEWEICEDGTRRGSKHGYALDGSREWKENWSGDPSSPQFFVDKFWNEVREGGTRVRWGEVEGHEGAKQWKQTWGESSVPGENTGKRWLEKWDDDGLGNVQTLKEGEDWVQGQTTNWFFDKYGQCLGTQEKWAYKKGHDDAGNVWMEKWKELPGHKEAEKTGSNREGDVWTEKWTEHYEGEETPVKWAEKTGKNAKGEEWLETWLEEGEVKKRALKKGKNREEEWEEKWGEEHNPDGSGEKWTSRWARSRKGEEHATGQSWGDRWGPGGVGGHHWGEKWHNNDIEKWWRDTAGRPAGC